MRTVLDFVPEDHGQATVRAKVFANCSSHFTPERFSARPPLVLPANQQSAKIKRHRAHAEKIAQHPARATCGRRCQRAQEVCSRAGELARGQASRTTW